MGVLVGNFMLLEGYLAWTDWGNASLDNPRLYSEMNGEMRMRDNSVLCGRLVPIPEVRKWEHPFQSIRAI